jgi:two-component system response regulator AtoC
MNNSILVIDDERHFLDSVRRGLISSGFNNVRLENDPNEALGLFGKGQSFDIALIDISMPRTSGVEVLEGIKNISPNTECLMVTAINEATVAVDCMRKGAYDYLVKPISRDDMVLAVKRALERKRFLDILDPQEEKTIRELIHVEAFSPIITRSAKVLRILKEAELHAASNVPVLITGESGTGKELLSHAIHSASSRARFPFTPVNMASLTGTLFDAEFFGHTRGAFTGAEKDRIGYLEQSDKGTLFLDEIGTLPLEFQGKLLRVLQEREYFKLGSSKPQKTHVRFIAATNADIDRLLDKGLFRKDLYYRLKGAWLHLPPLRERKEDIPLLINYFIETSLGDSGNSGIEEDAVRMLVDYNYPGNIRELKSILYSALNLAQGRPISANLLPRHMRRRKKNSKGGFQKDGGPIHHLEQVERAYILRAYEHTGRNKSQTARLLDIGLNTLRRRLESYGVR